jgi:ParB-like chromosome segregation protein Spo0J
MALTPQMQFHPLADIFPLMEGKVFQELVEDVRTNGLMEPINTFEGKIIDGRNRYRACIEAAVKPRFIEFDGSVPLINFIVSLNLHRRHLDTGQRSMVAAKLANMRQGERTDLLPDGERLSQEQASALLNVSPRSTARARTILQDGDPELSKAVESGGIRLATAGTINPRCLYRSSQTKRRRNGVRYPRLNTLATPHLNQADPYVIDLLSAN